jgi:hypothetical protein
MIIDGARPSASAIARKSPWRRNPAIRCRSSTDRHRDDRTALARRAGGSPPFFAGTPRDVICRTAPPDAGVVPSYGGASQSGTALGPSEEGHIAELADDAVDLFEVVHACEVGSPS